MGTKSNPGAYDCYANADPDEPMFVLLARDKHAPTLVWLWALLREIEGEEPAKVAEARDCVDDMIQWQVAHGRKAIGVGHAALVAVMGLVRAANAGVTAAKNQATRDEELQRFICMTLFENPALEQALDPGATTIDGAEYKPYRKAKTQLLRPYVPGEDLTGVSVSERDVPGPGGMIAVNPEDPKDRWYVAADFFRDNYVAA